jgi:hypothetical protein
MPQTTKNAVVTLETLFWVPDPLRDQNLDFRPGVWAVFFKIDGSTAQAGTGKLIGTATVSGTTGTGVLGSSLKLGGSVAIPPEIGQWTGQVEPISLGDLGSARAGVFGVAVVVFDPSDLAADALEAGQADLNESVEKALNTLIANMKPSQVEVGQSEIDAAFHVVGGEVEAAVQGAMSFWEELHEEFLDNFWFEHLVVKYSADDLPIRQFDQVDFRPTVPAGTVGDVGVSGAICQVRHSVGQGVLGHFDSGVRAVAGFTSPDGYKHVIVATEDGNVTELWWQGSGAVGRGEPAHFNSPILALAGFTSPDGYKHSIVATEDGNVTELWWQGSGAVGRGELAHFTRPMLAIAGFSSPDDYKHVIVATENGHVEELSWQGASAVGRRDLAHFDSRVIDLAGYASDGYQHVIAATEDGKIRTASWHGATPVSAAVLVEVEAYAWSHAIGVGAFYDPADEQQHAIVAMSNGELREFHWTPPELGDVPHDDLANLSGMQPIIDAFFDASGYQHAIASTTAGDIHELWWKVPPDPNRIVARQPIDVRER